MLGCGAGVEEPGVHRAQVLPGRRLENAKGKRRMMKTDFLVSDFSFFHPCVTVPDEPTLHAGGPVAAAGALPIDWHVNQAGLDPK